MKKHLIHTLCLATCLILLSPAAALATTDNTAESSFGPIINTADLTGSIPDDIISISKQNTPNNVIFNYGGITLTLVDYFTKGETLYLYIDANNNTDQTYRITAFNVLVNGFPSSSLTAINAAPNQITEGYLAIDNFNYHTPYSSMNEVSDLQFRMEIIDPVAYQEATANGQEYNQFIHTPELRFRDYSVPQKAYDSGTPLFHDYGFKLVKKDLFISNSGSADLHLLLYMENTNSQATRYDDIGFYLNNQLVDPTFKATLDAGSRTVFELVITAEELNYLGVHSLADIQSFTSLITIYNNSDGLCFCGCQASQCFCDSSFDDLGAHTFRVNLLK